MQKTKDLPIEVCCTYQTPVDAAEAVLRVTNTRHYSLGGSWTVGSTGNRVWCHAKDPHDEDVAEIHRLLTELKDE